MSLKFKRNYPILLLLIAILSFLAFVMGGQSIIAYTIKVETQPVDQAATLRFDVANDMVGLSAAQTAWADSQSDGSGEVLSIISETVTGEYLTKHSAI